MGNFHIILQNSMNINILHSRLHILAAVPGSSVYVQSKRSIIFTIFKYVFHTVIAASCTFAAKREVYFKEHRHILVVGVSTVIPQAP